MENAKEAATAPATGTPKEASAPAATATAAAAGGAGLRGVVAASSSIGDVNGEQGILIYQGYDIHDLAEHSTFEETVYLLWHGRLPTAAEFETFKRDIGAHYELPPQVIELIRQFPREAEPMDMLRTAVSALDFYDKECCDISRDGALRTATRLTAQFPVLVAAIERLRNGQDPIPANPELNIATNFLYMLKGEMPTEREARIFDICLILHADHELNASTFTARVVAGTLADVYGAVTAAIAALSGPLHGGANTNVMKMLLEMAKLTRRKNSSETRSRRRRRSWASATPSIRRKTRAPRTCASSRRKWASRRARRSGTRFPERSKTTFTARRACTRTWISTRLQLIT